MHRALPCLLLLVCRAASCVPGPLGDSGPNWPPPQPGRAIHVACDDPNAADTGDGSPLRPFKTINRAVEAMQPGDTVWVHPGLYRETLRVDKSGDGFDRMLSIRAVPGEPVVVSGAEPLTGWTRAADEPDRAIYETDWTRPDIYPGMVACDDQPLIPLSIPDETEALKPPAAYCQYFIGYGRGRERMVPGSFFYDKPRGKLLVWLKGDEDPRAHQLEIAVRGAFYSSGNYLFIEGISFRYAPLVVAIGGVVFVMCGPGGGGAPAEGCIVRDCEVSLGAFEGIVVRGGKRTSTWVEDCWVHHNGNGAGGFEGQGDADTDSWMIVRRCRLTDNNLFNWNPAWHAGGKHFGNRVLFDQCEFTRAHNAPGLWFDCGNRDCVVNRCYAHQNGGNGLYYEIGETGAFLNSIVEAGPHYPGIAAMGSSRTLIAHNAIRTSAGGIYIGGQGKVDDKASRVCCHNGAFNNLVIGRDKPIIAITPELDIATGNTSDNNLLWSETAATALFEPAPDGSATAALAVWQQGRSLDLATRVLDPRAVIARGRLNLAPDSPALIGGKPLTPQFLRAFFAVKPMPALDPAAGAQSIADHREPSAAFLNLVSILVASPANAVPVGPLPQPSAPRPTQLPTANADFESPALAPGAVSEVVPNWDPTGPGKPQIWNATRTGLWNWNAPSGDNLLTLLPGEALTVSQALDATLQPSTRYRLSVWAGKPINEAALPWPRVTLRLYAGDSLLRTIEVPEPRIIPHVGVWVESVLTFTSSGEVPPGQRLKLTIERHGSTKARTCFDDATLTALPL